MGSLVLKALQKNKLEDVNNNLPGFFDAKVKDIRGKDVDFASFRGKYKAFLVVNVACACGLTSDNYTQLVQLYEKYGAQGLNVLGFPCNQFMGQESRNEADIEEYIKTNFHVEFPMFSKIDVNGPQTHPLFAFLRRNSPLFDAQTGQARQVPWNFAKFLLNADGQVVGYYEPSKEPKEAEPQIRELLGLGPQE